MVERRRPEWRRKGESLDSFERRRMAYTDRVIGDKVSPKGIRAKARCPGCNNSIYRGGVVYRGKLYHKKCADTAKTLRKILRGS